MKDGVHIGRVMRAATASLLRLYEKEKRMIKRPTSDEVKKTLGVYNLLSRFEANHRQIHSWGVFTEQDVLPIPEILKVEAWLRSEFNIPEEIKDESKGTDQTPPKV
jgi:hypothetical protein